VNENKAIRSKPVKIILADALFFLWRKDLILFKDLGMRNIHYSVFTYGSTIDIHQTFEGQVKTHIPLAKIELDWQFLLNRMNQEIGANWGSICRTIKCEDPRWEDLEIEFLPIQVLPELLRLWRQGVRWNVNTESLQKLESSVVCSRLGDLADRGNVFGAGSGYLVLSNGTDCSLFDTDRMGKIIEKSIAMSVRKILLRNYTLSLMLWCAKIRLYHLQADILSGKIPCHLRESLFLHSFFNPLCSKTQNRFP
jgi:hypothetical protein